MILLGISTAVLTRAPLRHVFTIRTENVRRMNSIKVVIIKHEPEELWRSQVTPINVFVCS